METAPKLFDELLNAVLNAFVLVLTAPVRSLIPFFDCLSSLTALFALPLTGKDLSMISLVSLIMLAGTVVNASIVLVDYIKQRRDRGETRVRPFSTPARCVSAPC